MATREFIQKRIEGKEKEIVKLEKKIERILKAKETGWEVNPYYYSESDLRWTNKDLEEAKASLAKYQAELEIENEKAAGIVFGKQRVNPDGIGTIFLRASQMIHHTPDGKWLPAFILAFVTKTLGILFFRTA